MKIPRISAFLPILAALTAAAGVSYAVRQAEAVGPPVTLEGELQVTHSDDFGRGKAGFEYALKTSQGLVRVEFTDPNPALPAQGRVRVRGDRSGNVLRVPAGGAVEAAGGSTSTSGSTAVAAVTGSKRVAVVLFKFSASQAEPYTPATARGVAFDNTNSVAAYYNEVSYGQLSLTGDVFGWYTISGDTSACNYGAWGTAANAAASAAGVDLSTYNYVVYAFPSVSACGWAGLAYLPGTRSYLNGSGGMSLRVMAHELGHNLGTHHASTWTCTEGGVRVAISATTANCTQNEYGDPVTVMGSSQTRHQTNFSLGNFGWLATSNTRDVTANGTYTLTAANDPDPAAVKALRIARPTGDYLLLELRKPYGQYFDTFSATDPAVTGVSVRITPGYGTLSQSKLIDATPLSTSGFGDAALPVGASLRDPVRGVIIGTVSVTNGVATVSVSFDADTTGPTKPSNLTAAALSSTQVGLTWGASSDNIGVTGYEVRRGSVLLGTTSSTSFTDVGLTGGTPYSYDVRAVDGSGNVSDPATATATTPVPDGEAPSAPTNLRATLAAGKPTRVSLQWIASTDNVVVTNYVVYRGATQVATVPAGTTSYFDRAPRGTWNYTVKAVDGAGNVSGASNTATVTVTK